MTQEELKNIAPKLFELQKLKNNFNVPKNYFDGINEFVTSSIFLGSLSKQNSFKTPINYFDTIESVVIDTIQIENNSIPDDYFSTVEDKVFKILNKEPKVISIKKKNTRFYIAAVSLAASILLVFTLKFSNSVKTNQFLSLDTMEIENWIDNGEIDISNYEIAAIYSDVNIDDIEIYSSFEDDEMLDYLDNLNVESLILIN